MLTPTVYTVIGHVTSSLKDHFARHALTAVVDWLKRRRKRQSYVTTTSSTTNGRPTSPPSSNANDHHHHPAASPAADVVVGGDVVETNGLGDDVVEDAINVVIADFVDLDPAYVEAVVGLNFSAGHPLPSSASADGLAPVIRLIQQEKLSSASREKNDDDTPANPPSHATPSQLLPPSGDTPTTTTTTSALSPRALTPTPLQYIDAGGNSPSVTPQRHGVTANNMGGDG